MNAPAPPGRTDLVRRADVVLRPDPARVAALLFLPGQEMAIVGASRAASVVERCLALDDADVERVVTALVDDHADRHRDLDAVLAENFAAVAHRVDGAATLPTIRRRLIGACFTMEYATEAAALFNPSLVEHPRQDDPAGRRVLFSLRAVGEGHRSSITFLGATLVDEPDGTPRVVLDPRSRFSTRGVVGHGILDRDGLRHQALAAGADAETLEFVLEALPDRLSRADLDAALERLDRQRLTRVEADDTIATVRRMAEASYEVTFAPDTDLSERSLWPAAPHEAHGVEDARFVRFTDDDGAVTYVATYTGYDGSRVSLCRLQTNDFVTFRSSPMTGRAATDKGLALFPHTVGGRHLAVSRWDRENNALSSSADGTHWDDAVVLQAPRQAWELIHLGNCGSPIETDRGWLVLTHAVGPMRTYAMGALLLDLDDPTRVLGCLPEPLLSPEGAERDGYVPNVVYSCGALVHRQSLVLPYGCSDSSVRIAMVDLPALLERLLAHPPRP